MAGFQYTSCVANSVLNELFAEEKFISADQLSDIVIEVDKIYKYLTGKDLLLERPMRARFSESSEAKLMVLSIIDFFDGSEGLADVYMRAPNRKPLMMKYKDGGDPNLDQAIYLALIDIRWGV